MISAAIILYIYIFLILHSLFILYIWLYIIEGHKFISGFYYLVLPSKVATTTTTTTCEAGWEGPNCRSEYNLIIFHWSVSFFVRHSSIHPLQFICCIFVHLFTVFYLFYYVFFFNCHIALIGASTTRNMCVANDIKTLKTEYNKGAGVCFQVCKNTVR